MLDKIEGGLFGLAVGDALGGTTEFMSEREIKERYGRINEIIGGGCWNLKPGETTDDTEMTICVLKGIIASPQNPIKEIGKEFLRWWKTDPKDIGITVQTAFNFYQGDWFQAAEKAHDELDGKSAGNGTLMRCLPVALAYSDLQKINEVSALQSQMTHYDDLASEACIIYNRIASRLLNGEALEQAIQAETKHTRYASSGVREPDCPPDGYVVHTMEWVLYWLLSSNSFEEVVIGAANMGNDSDTISAIAGGLKGIEIGFRKIPSRFTDKLLLKDDLHAYAKLLYEMRDNPSAWNN